jgi:hypothetical protein
MTTIVLKHQEWRDLQQRITDDYGIVVSMVSWKTKEVLGFTVRHHTGYSVWNKRYDDDIRLDFVDDERLVFFKLKYYDN